MEEKSLKPSGSKMKLSQYIGYTCGEMGYTMQNTIIASYMVMYFTNAVGINPLVIGTMTLLCRIIDAFTDIGFGLLVDRTKTKIGRFRPWYIGSIVPTTIAFLLVFFVPGSIANASALAVMWMYIMYILWGSVFATIDYTWLNAQPSVATANPQERKNMSTWRMWGASLAGVIISYLGIDLIIKFNMPAMMAAGDPTASPMSFRNGYLVMGLIVGAITLVLFIVSAICCKERPQTTEEEQKRVSFKEGFRAVKGNKLLLGALLCNVVMFMFATYTTGLTGYFYENWYGNPAIIGTVMATGGIIGLVFNTVVVPIINKKLRKEQIHPIAVVGIIVAFVILYVAPRGGSLVWFIIGWGLFQCMIHLANVMFFRTLPESIDWGEWKNGVYAPGVVSSITSFVQKIGMGISTFVMTAVLAIVGFNSNLGFGEMQSEATAQGIHLAYLIGPIVFVLLTLVGYFVIRSVKKEEILQMRKDLAEKRGVEFDEKNALI